MAQENKMEAARWNGCSICSRRKWHMALRFAAASRRSRFKERPVIEWLFWERFLSRHWSQAHTAANKIMPKATMACTAKSLK